MNREIERKPVNSSCCHANVIGYAEDKRVYKKERKDSMKKILVMFTVMVVAISMASCGNTAASEANEETETEPTKVTLAPEVVDSEESFGEAVLMEVDHVVVNLKEEHEKLTADIDTYDKFVKNVDKVEELYGRIYQDTVDLGIRLREHSADYVEAVISSGKSNDEMNEAMENLYECIYEDAGEAVYDGIYDGIMEDMYDAFYDGILEDGYDVAPYDDWLDTCSDEYDRWLDTSSDVYDAWQDSQSDIYDFWLDVEGEIWDGDMEKAQEIVEAFRTETTE